MFNQYVNVKIYVQFQIQEALSKAPSFYITDDIFNNEVILESKTKTFTLLIYPMKNKKEREPGAS